MKYIHKIFIPSLLLLLVTAACDTDELHDLNVDPNSVKQIDINYFLTAAELGSASAGSSGDNRYTDWRTNIGMGAHVVQHFATTASGRGLGASGDKYFEDDAEQSNAPFQFFLTDVGRTTAEIIRQTGEGGYAEGKNVNTRQAARILRVLNFHRLTDFYGSIPYFEANQGLDGVFSPVYDKQRAVYADLLKELDEATAGFVSESDVDQPGFAKADFIYDGNTAQWKKFGFSLMLRLAMRISNVDAATAATYVSKAAAGGVFTSNDDNVWVTMADGPSEWTNQNGISRAMDPGDGGQSKDSFLAKTFIDWLKGTNPGSTADDDPRLMIFSAGIGEWTGGTDFVPVAGGLDPLNQEGMPNGYDQAGIDALNGGPTSIKDTYSSANWKMFQDSDPYILMHYAEVEFLLAEAVERAIGSVSGTAKEHYEKGVKAAMQMWTPLDASLTVSDAAVTTYLATYEYGVHKPALEMIGEQMWASKFLNWWDAWSDQRRTGFPALTPTNFTGNDTGGSIPQKLLLPAREATINPNYETGATLPDRFTTKVWWAGGPE